jgi:hypothetical protein
MESPAGAYYLSVIRQSRGEEASMLYVRTAAGGFVNAAMIVQLSPQRGGGDEITSWVAICRDGQAVTLADYYAVPGRIEKDLKHLLPQGRRVADDYCLPECCVSGS